MKKFIARRAGALSQVGAEFAVHVAANYPSVGRIEDKARLDLASSAWLDHVTAVTESPASRLASLRGDVVDVDVSPDQRQLAILTQVSDPPAVLLYLINTSTSTDAVAVLPDPLDVAKLMADRLGLCARFVPAPGSGLVLALKLRNCTCTVGRKNDTLLVLSFLYISMHYIGNFFNQVSFLRATAGTAIARLSHRNSVRPSVRPSVCLSVCHTGGSGKNGAS